MLTSNVVVELYILLGDGAVASIIVVGNEAVGNVPKISAALVTVSLLISASKLNIGFNTVLESLQQNKRIIELSDN